MKPDKPAPEKIPWQSHLQPAQTEQKPAIELYALPPSGNFSISIFFKPDIPPANFHRPGIYLI
jgi:hypothetical protein